MSGRLASKIAIITGAASGIGRETARVFAQEGARLVLGDVSVDAVQALATELRDADASVEAIALDVRDTVSVQAAIDTAVDTFGGLHVLVNSAGISRRSVHQDASFDEAWERIMEVNAKGTLLMSHAASQPMLQSGGGAVVNLASVMGTVVHDHHNGLSDGFNGYSHSKGAVIQMTRDLGVQYGARGIRVNAVCPGFIYTTLIEGVTANNKMHQDLIDRHPVGRLGEPREVAQVIAFLASDEASFVNAAIIPVDGGYTAI